MRRGLLNIVPGLLVLAGIAGIVLWRGGPLAAAIAYAGILFAIFGLPVLLFIGIIVAAIRITDRR